MRQDGPALEVLRHAVHDPGAVGRWLDPELFDDDVHRGAYQAPARRRHPCRRARLVAPEVADLLARLLVAEPGLRALRRRPAAAHGDARRHIAAVRLAGAREADGTQALADLATLTRIMDGLRKLVKRRPTRPTGC